MPDAGQAAAGEDTAKKGDGRDAGAFTGVRRRRPPARNTAAAAALVAAAEEVADAGFLGTSTAGGSQPTEPQALGVVLTPPELEVDEARSTTVLTSKQSEHGPEDTPPPASVSTHEIPAARVELLNQLAPPAEEAPAEQAPAEEAPAEQAPAEEAPAEQAPAEQAPAEQAPAEEAPAEQAPADSKTAKAPPGKQRKISKASPLRQGPTLLQLEASFADSRTNSKQWSTSGANMVPEVWDALRARIARDRRSASNPELAAGHYMDVVFRNAPMDADALIDLYQKLADQRMGYLGAGKKSTFRLGPAARENASEMKAILDEADYARKGLYVVSAMVVQLLRRLEEEGPLQRPELPPLL